MAISSRHPDLLAALEPLVGDIGTCSRVVIDIQVDHAVKVHVERFGGPTVIDVIRALNGPGTVDIREVSDGEAGRPR